MMIRNNLLKKIDSLFGPLFVNISIRLFTLRASVVDDIKSILVIRPGGLGDAVLLVPVIYAIKDKYPSARITILAEKRNGAVFELCPVISEIFRYERLPELFVAIRNRYDAVIDSEQWHRLSAVVATLTRVPIRIGFATNERERLFTHRIPYLHDDHEIDSFARLTRPLIGDAAVTVKPPFLTVPEAAQKKADAFLMPLHGLRIVAIFPGGSIKERQWGAERFHAVSLMLVARGYGIVVIGGREDIKSGKIIASELANAVDLCGKTSLTETAGVIERACLLITGDSGMMHIAYGLDIPTVSLFGPGIEKKWAPRGRNHIVINKHLPCSPCTKFGYTPRCKRNAQCMKLIIPEEVFEKAIDLLEGKKPCI